MTYSQKFEKDIFISYCHADNDNPIGEGWIEQFHKLLRSRLKQILGARKPEEEPSFWRDKKLQGNDEFAEVLVEELRRVALVVSILSPSYIRSEWCLKEIEEFHQATQQSGGLIIAHKSRIFKVLKTPVERDEHPRVLHGQTGYDFFALDKDTQIPQEFTLQKGDTNTAKALQIINDLAYHIKATLDVINSASESKPTVTGEAIVPQEEPEPSQASIYLAETSFELDDERNQVKRELEARGFMVLPAGELPVRDPNQFKQAVHDDLERCQLSVHMIGANRSIVLPGESEDVLYLQNQLAAERSGDSDLDRLIWLPPELETTDERQQKFIDMLQRDPEAQRNADVLRIPLQELITSIHDTLKKQEQAKKQTAKSADHRRVYVISAPEDAEAVDPLKQHLFDKGFEWFEPLSDPDANEEEIFKIHKMNLMDCDAAILYFGKAREFWFRSQLSEIQRAVGWRGGSPIKPMAIYLGQPMTPSKERFRTHEILLKGTEEFSPDTLAPFLAELGEQVRGHQ